MEKELNKFDYCDIYYVFESTNKFKAVYGGKAIEKAFIQEPRIMKDYVIYIVSEGSIYLSQQDRYVEVKAKQMLLNFPFIKHFGYQKADATFYWFHFTCDKEPQEYQKDRLIEAIKNDKHFLDNKIILPYHCDIKNYNTIVLLISLYLQALTENRNIECENYYVSLICAEISRQEIANLLEDKKEMPYRFKKVVEYFNLYYYSIESIGEMADKFGYNSKYLSALFKKYLNVSPKKYLDDIRVNHADAILVDTDLSIKEIASLVGFDDSHVFMKAYKKSRGMTPTTFRTKKH